MSHILPALVRGTIAPDIGLLELGVIHDAIDERSNGRAMKSLPLNKAYKAEKMIKGAREC